jgi:hypothetical protein
MGESTNSQKEVQFINEMNKDPDKAAKSNKKLIYNTGTGKVEIVDKSAPPSDDRIEITPDEGTVY